MNHKINFREDKNLIIHLTVTGRCNARCRGCINSAITMASNKPRNMVTTFAESVPERDTAIIEKLIRRHPGKKATVCFYGGEPFLATEKMTQVWEKLSNSKPSKRIRYMIYTNGEFFIDAIKSHPDFIKSIWLYSVSIDGDEKQHNRSRPGTNLRMIVKNLQALRNVYKGKILMWSTLREEQSLLNCYEEFTELYRLNLVDSLYWHWPEIVEPFKDLARYKERYCKELAKIIDFYIERLRLGELLPIIHLNELILYLLSGKKRRHSACAIELLRNYDLVGGKIYYCVDLPSHIGCIEENPIPSSLVVYKKTLGCFKCSIHTYCGGRCPVQGLFGSLERTRQYCQLMKLHVGIVNARIDEITEYLIKNGLTLQEVYDRSAFLTRYTDVVP